MLDLRALVLPVEGDATRLHRFRKLPYQVDLQEPRLEGSALDVDMIGEVEDPLEGSGRDALIEILVLVLFGLTALHSARPLW